MIIFRFCRFALYSTIRRCDKARKIIIKDRVVCTCSVGLTQEAQPLISQVSVFKFALQVQLLENDRKTKENQISTMEAALEKSKEESSSLEHELGVVLHSILLSSFTYFRYRDAQAKLANKNILRY